MAAGKDADDTLRLRLPALHPGQLAVKAEAARFNVVAAGRRWGKNVLGSDVVIKALLDGLPVGWFSPTYRTLADDWRQLIDRLALAVTVKNEAEHRLALMTGGVCEMWSLDEPDSARGRAYALIVVDEAASVTDLGYAWQQVLRPMLTDYSGSAWFLSTPRGLDYFWQLYTMGKDLLHPEWRSWQRPTSENPHVPAADIERAKADLPDAVFRTEYLAEFLEGSGQVFRGVLEAATAERQERAVGKHPYIIGVDWAKQSDFTVFAVVDCDLKACVYVDRMNTIDFQVQIARLEALIHRFRPDAIIAERTGIGDVLVEQLMRADLPVRPFNTTQQSKRELVERLMLAFERGRLKIPNDPVLLHELQAFHAEKLPSGQLRYGAPAGGHDDTVIALALAWWGAHEYPDPLPRGIVDWRGERDPGEPPEEDALQPTGYIAR